MQCCTKPILIIARNEEQKFVISETADACRLIFFTGHGVFMRGYKVYLLPIHFPFRQFTKQLHCYHYFLKDYVILLATEHWFLTETLAAERGSALWWWIISPRRRREIIPLPRSQGFIVKVTLRTPTKYWAL